MNRRKKRLGNVIWPGREVGNYPNIYVELDDDEAMLRVCFSPERHGMMEVWRVERSLARLLAKRINQCLDETVLR